MMDDRDALETALRSMAETAELAEMAPETAESAILLERLAAAVFPPEQRDRAHLTWRDAVRGNSGAVDPAHAAEQRLRAAEARCRHLMEQIPAVTFMAALGEGENEVYVSPHIEAMLGFTQREWLEDPFLWYRQLHEDDRTLWNEEFARGCRNGGPFRAECRFLARNGHIIWVRGEARIIRDELGRPLYLQGVAFDITDNKRAQELLLDRAVREARYAEELTIARRVQTSILPRDLRIPGLEIAAAMEPAEEVGGDYFEVLPCNGGAWLGIGDVSGHGLTAGVVMLMMQSAFAALVRTLPDAPPRVLVSELNRVLYENVRVRMTHDEHVTLTLLRYFPDGRIVYAGAHEYVLVHRHRTGQLDALFTPGPWVGAARDVSHAAVDSSLQLEPGDLLVLHTDGVTEAMNGDHQQFGLERLMSAIVEASAQGPKAVVDHVLSAVHSFSAQQLDDITILAARYSSSGG